MVGLLVVAGAGFLLPPAAASAAAIWRYEGEMAPTLMWWWTIAAGLAGLCIGRGDWASAGAALASAGASWQVAKRFTGARAAGPASPRP